MKQYSNGMSLYCFRETFDVPKRIDIGTDTNCLIPVSDTPSFAITRLPGFGIPIVEGMCVSLKCEVDSNPASTPIWQRGKRRLKKKGKKRERKGKKKEKENLTLRPVSPADLYEILMKFNLCRFFKLSILKTSTNKIL